MDAVVERIVGDYVSKHTVGELKRRAAEYLEVNKCPSNMFLNFSGSVGFIIAMDLCGSGVVGSEEVVEAILERFGVSPGFVPVTAILRDALPLVVQLRNVLLPLTCGYIERREVVVKKLGELVRDLETADRAVGVSWERLQEMAREVEEVG